MKTSIKPCGHHVVVLPFERPKTTESGIIIRSEGTEWDKIYESGRMFGTLLAVGPQAWKAHAANLLDLVDERDPALEAWASVGDTVLYARYAGKYVSDPVSGKQMYVLHDDDIIAVLPPQEEWTVKLEDLMEQ